MEPNDKDIKTEVWRSQILSWALSSVISDLKDIPNPDLPANIVAQLESILLDIDSRNCFTPSVINPDLFKTDVRISALVDDILLNTKAKATLENLITVKLKKHLSLITQFFISRLTHTDSKEDNELWSKLKQSKQSMTLIKRLIDKEKTEHQELQKVISDHIQVRSEKVTALQNTLNKVGNIIGEVHHPTQEAEWNSILSSTREYIAMQNQLLELNLKKIKLEELIEGSPEYLMQGIKEKHKELQEAIAEIELESAHWADLETKYESLGPKFKELKAQWEDIEGKISVKEWSLRELEKAQNISGMEDSFLGDSFS